MSENRTGIRSLVHDDRCRYHRHTYHTADGKIGSGQKDQSRNTQCQEHTGRCLLKNVQDICRCEQLCVLHNRCDDAEEHEDADDYNVQSVRQKELLSVEGILPVLSLLRLILCKGKLRHAEQINQMVFVCEGLMLAILCLLKLALQSHLRIKLTVLIDVVLVLDFLLVGQAREILLVLCLQPGKGSVVLCLRIFLLFGAACHNLGIVVLLEMLIEILLGIRDQAVDLCLVLLLHGFCRYELFLIFLDQLALLFFGIVLIFLHELDMIVQINNHIRSVLAQLVDFRLDFTDILINWLTELVFLFHGKDCIRICHDFIPPLQVLRAQSEELFLICFLCVDDSCQMTVRHNTDPVGNTEDLRHLGGNHDDCLALLCHLNDQLINFVLRTDVNASGRIIHQEYLRITLQPFSENYLLLVSAGQTRNGILRSHAFGVHDADFPGGRLDHLRV